MKSTTVMALAAAAVSALVAAAEATQKSEDFRRVMPRYGGKKEIAADKDYGMSLALIAGIPILLAVITLLAFFVTCFCKLCSKCCGCCRRCCGDPNAVEGYSTKQRLLPLLTMVVFGAVCMAFAAAGLSENAKLTKTLLEDEPGAISFKSLVPRSIERVQQKVDNITRPVDDLLGVVDQAVVDGNNTINGVLGNIATGTSGFTNATADFNQTWSDAAGTRVTSSTGEDFDCIGCGTLAQVVGAIGAEVESGIGQTVADMQEIANNYQDDVLDVVDDIKDKVNDFKDQLDDNVQDSLNDARNESDKVIEKIEKYNPQRSTVTIVLFVVPIAALVLALVGALFKVALLFKINMWVYFLVCFVFWLLLGVTMPLAVVVGDACEYALNYETVTIPAKAIAEAGSDDKQYRIADACLKGENVIDKLNYTREFDFTDSLNFVTFGDINITEQFDLSQLNNLTSIAASANITTMYGYVKAVRVDARIDDFISSVGSPPIPSDLAGFVAANPANASFGLTGPQQANMTSLQAAMVVERDTIDDMEAKLAQLNSDVADLGTARDSSLNNIQAAVAPLDQLANITHPLLDAADRIKAQATCGVVADIYHEAYDLVCTRMQDHFITLSMCLFFIALFGWFIIIASSMSGNRWHRVAPDHAAEDYAGVPMKQVGEGASGQGQVATY